MVRNPWEAIWHSCPLLWLYQWQQCSPPRIAPTYPPIKARERRPWSGEWTGTVWKELKDSSSHGSPIFFFYQDVQSKYTVHCNVRTLSPVKRRKLHLTSFHSSPLAKPRSFFFLYVIILSLWRPYLSPGGELWRYPAETFETYLSLLLTKSHREVPATFIPIICPQASH